VQRAFVAAGPGVLPALSAFVTSCTAKPIRFGIQRPTNHLAKMIPDPGFINLDDLAHGLQSIVFEEAGNPESAKDSVRYQSETRIINVEGQR
jgi:hypothetical protein